VRTPFPRRLLPQRAAQGEREKSTEQKAASLIIKHLGARCGASSGIAYDPRLNGPSSRRGTTKSITQRMKKQYPIVSGQVGFSAAIGGQERNASSTVRRVSSSASAHPRLRRSERRSTSFPQMHQPRENARRNGIFLRGSSRIADPSKAHDCAQLRLAVARSRVASHQFAPICGCSFIR